MIRRARILGFRGWPAIGMARERTPPLREKKTPAAGVAGRGRLPSVAPSGAEPDEGGDVWVLTGKQAVRGGNLSSPRNAELHPQHVAVRFRGTR